jgi:putative oxidoreductase
MMKGFPVNTDLGLLLIRLMIAAVGMFHGSQKLFAAFGGPGIEGFAKMLDSMRVPVPTVSATLSGCAEFFGGLLLALGLFSRIGNLFFAFNMLVAVSMVHWKNGFSGQGGYEYPLTLAVVLVALIISGPGRYAVTPRL